MKTKHLQSKWLFWSALGATVSATGGGVFYILWQKHISDAQTQEEMSPPNHFISKNQLSPPTTLDFDKPLQSLQTEEDTPSTHWSSFNLGAQPNSLLASEQQLYFLSNHMVFQEEESTYAVFRFIGLQDFVNQWAQLVIVDADSESNVPSIQHFWKIQSSFENLSVSGLLPGKTYRYWLDINGQRSAPRILEALPLPNVSISSIDVGFDTTTVFVTGLNSLFVLRANNPAFKTTNLYLAFQKANSPHSLVQKILILPSLEDKAKVLLQNLEPNTEYKFWLTYSQDFLIHPLKQVLQDVTYNRVASDIVDPLVKVVKPNQVTIGIDNLRYLPASGKTFQFFLEPAKGRASRIEVKNFTFASPVIDPDSPPPNTKAVFDPTRGTLTLDYSFFNLTPGVSYFVQIVETEQLSKERQTYGITSRSFRTKTFESLDEAPDFKTPLHQVATYPYISPTAAVIRLPNFAYLSKHDLRVFFRKQGEENFVEAVLQNTGLQLLAYLEKLLPNTKYDYIVEDVNTNLLYSDTFSTLSSPFLDLSKTTHSLKTSNLVFSLLDSFRNQPLTLKLSTQKSFQNPDFIQTLTQQTATSSLTFKLQNPKPNQIYYYRLFDFQNQLITQGEFLTPNSVAFLISPGLNSADFFFQRQKHGYNKDVASHNHLFLEYRKLGDIRFNKQLILQKTDGDNYGLVTLQNLQPDSTYEFRFSTLNNGSFFGLGSGKFSTLSTASLKVVDPPSTVKQKEYVFEFSSSQHQDWNFFLEFLPSAHPLYYTQPTSTVTPKTLKVDSGLFGPTKVIRKNNRLFYYFHIPKNLLSPNQQYFARVVAKKPLSFANNTEISSILSEVLYKTSPAIFEHAPTSDLLLLHTTPVSFYTSSGVLQLRVTAALFEEMQKSTEYDYFLTYEVKADDAHIQEVLGPSVTSALMVDSSFTRTRLFGKFQIFANTLKSEPFFETPFLPNVLPQEEAVILSALRPQTYYQRSFLLDTLLPNTPYQFSLKRRKKSPISSSPAEEETIFEKELKFASYFGNVSHLESLVFDQSNIYFRFKNLAEFKQFSNLYLAFKVRLQENSQVNEQKRVDLLSFPRILSAASNTHFNDSLKNTFNRFNRLKINSDNTATLTLSWTTFEKIYGVSRADIATIDWAIMAAGQRNTAGSDFLSPDSTQQFNSWVTLMQSQPEERINPRDIIQTNRILVATNHIDGVVDLPKRFASSVSLRYLQTTNSPRVLNSELADNLPDVSTWAAFDEVNITNNTLSWQLPNTLPNSTYFFALVSNSDASQVLWRSHPVKTHPLISDVITNRVRLLPLQKIHTSLVSPIYLLHGQSPNLTLESAIEIDVARPKIELSNLEINKRYYYKVVDSKHATLEKMGEFISGDFVSVSTKNSSNHSVTLTLEGLKGKGTSFFFTRLSHLLRSSFELNKPHTLPMLFEYRLLEKDSLQPWKYKQLFVDPFTDKLSFTIDGLLPNQTYEYRLLAYNPLKPDLKLFLTLLESFNHTQTKSLNEVFEQIALRFLDYFYFERNKERVFVSANFDQQLLQEDIDKLLAPLRTQHFLSKEFALQLQNSFVQAVRFSFDDIPLKTDSLLEAKNTLTQKLLNFFLTHFSTVELETELALRTYPLFETKSQILQQAFEDETLISLTQPSLSIPQTFHTSVTDATVFSSHDNSVLVLNQEVLKKLSSQKTPPRLSIVLRNNHNNTLQKETFAITQIPLLAHTSHIFFQINQIKEQFDTLSLEEQKAKFGLSLLEQIASLEDSIAKYWILEITQKPWNFLLLPNTSYTLSLFVSGFESEAEQLFFQKSLTTQPLLEVSTLSARAPGVIGLSVKGVSGLANSQIIVFFRKHSYSQVLPVDELFSNTFSVAQPILWEEGKTKLLAQRWYYKIFNVPENTQSFDTYIDVGSENTEVDYVVLSYNASLKEYGIRNNDFFRNSLQKGLVRSGASTQKAILTKNTLIFEGNFAQDTWSKLTTLGELGLLTVGRNTETSHSLEGWELPLINSLVSLRLNSSTTGESVWYDISTPKNTTLKNWFVWKNPKTLERFLVYYAGVKIHPSASQPQKVVFFELHFRLTGDRISARVVASKTVSQTNAYQDPLAFEWANLVGRNVDFKLLTNAETSEYQIGGLGFSLTSTSYAAKQTDTVIHRYNLTAKTEPLFASRVPATIVRGEFNFLNQLFNSAFFESFDGFSKSMKQLWRGARLYFMGALSTFDGWLDLQTNTNTLRYSFVEGPTEAGVGVRLLYRQNNEVFGFQLHAVPFFDTNQNLSLVVRITDSPKKLLLSAPQEFNSLSWEEFFSLAQPVSLATNPTSPGINIGAIQFDLPFPAKELQEQPLLVPKVSINSRPFVSVTPQQQKPLLLPQNSNILPQNQSFLIEKVWYDPDFSTTQLTFQQLKPQTEYLLFYWLKTQKPYSENEIKDVLKLLLLQEQNAVLNFEKGFVSFNTTSTSHTLVLNNLALNTHYSFALFEKKILESSLDKLITPLPVISDSFLSLVFANEQFYSRPQTGFEVSYRASGWKSAVNKSSFLSTLFTPFWYLLKFSARILMLDRIFTFFTTPKQLIETSQSDPLGLSFVPKIPEGMQFPSLREFWNWIYYYKSFLLNLKEVFGQNYFANNSWMSRPGLDRLNRWEEFQQAISRSTREVTETPQSVFGQDPTQQIHNFREFIENNIKALRVGGAAFGVAQPGEGPWLPAFSRLTNYSKLVPFNGVGNFLGYSLNPEQEVLKLYYFLPITTNIPSNIQEPTTNIKGVVFSFVILLPKTQKLSTQQDLTNRIFAAIEGVVSAPSKEHYQLLAALKKLDFKTYQTSEFQVVESYQELVESRNKQALFISDFLFDFPQ